MPSNAFTTMVAHAKAHHDSINAAYQATYFPGASTSSTPQVSRQGSASSEHADRNITKAWKAIKKHHRDMNEAYAIFYNPTPASSRPSSAAATPKTSYEGVRHETEAEQPRNYVKVWNAIKTKAVEHHRSVNNASTAIYGA